MPTPENATRRRLTRLNWLVRRSSSADSIVARKETVPGDDVPPSSDARTERRSFAIARAER